MCVCVPKITLRLLGSGDGGKNWWMRSSHWIDCPSPFCIYLFIFHLPLWPVWEVGRGAGRIYGCTAQNCVWGWSPLQEPPKNKTGNRNTSYSSHYRWISRMVLEIPKHIGTQGLYSIQGEAGPDPSDTSLLTDWKAKTDDLPGKLVFCCHFLSLWLPRLLFGTSSLLSPQSPASFLTLLTFYSSPLMLGLAVISYLWTNEALCFSKSFQFDPCQRRLTELIPCDSKGEWGF